MPCALGNLKHHRRFLLFARFHNGLEQLHVVDVEGANRVFAFQCFGKQFSGMGQWHSLWSLIRNRFLAIRDRIVEIAVEKGNKNPIAHPTLNYVATVPDPPGASLAFVAEAIRRADPSTYRRVAQQVICGTGIVRMYHRNSSIQPIFTSFLR